MRELKQARIGSRTSPLQRRTPPGVRELKPDFDDLRRRSFGRTPPGVRELKLSRVKLTYQAGESHPSRGA